MQPQQSFTPTARPEFNLPSLPSPLDPTAWATAFLRPVGVWAWYGAMSVLGAVLILAGLVVLMAFTRPGQAVLGIVSHVKGGGQ